MPIELIDKIKPKNNGDFKLVDAEDVGFEDGKSLPEKIEEVKDAIKDITGTEGEVNTIEGAIVKSKEYTDTKITEVNEKITTATNNIASLDERVVETESHVVNKNNPHSVTAAQVGAYNKTEVENLINTLKNQLLGGAGDAFDTLKELADALGNDPNFATTIANQIAGKYTKPSAGIPKTDLASAVQTSLNKADSAVQEETDPTVPSWAKQANKPSYTPDEIGAQEKLTSGTNIKTVNNQSLLGEGNIEIKTDLSNYYNKGEVDSKLGGKANSNHTHDIGNIVDLQTKLDSISENAEQALNNYLPLSGGTLTDRLNIKGNNENGVLRIHYGSNPNEASIGFFKDNVCKKTFGISHQINDELGYYDNAGDNTWHVLASQDWVNGNYLPLSGGIMTGQLNFQSMGDCHIKAGNGDGASLETQNLRISSWWGIGFYDTNGQKCSIVFDTRNGNAIFTGSLNVNSNQKVATESWVNSQGFMRSIDINKIYPVGSIYMSFRNTSPASFIGGSWAQLSNTFLYASTSDVVEGNGARFGEANHKLTVNEIPSHNHTTIDGDNWGSSGGDFNNPTRAIAAWSSGGWTFSANTSSTGGGQEHNNMPPYTKVYMWRRTS